MSLTTSIGTGGTNSRQTTAEEANALATDILNAGVIGTTAATSGVAPMTGGFAVNAQGSPDTTVAVSAGILWTTATPTGGNSQKVRTKNSASANVTIAANATGATRYDWLYLKIDPDKLANSNSGGTDIATLVTSRSTSATTDNGTPPTYGTLIAVVTVANGFSTITNGTIADKRTPALAGVNSASSFFAVTNFVESGCIWSGDAYASTLAASMTAGYIWIGGVRLTVAAVTARAFTASKDTYVDASDNGDGTALLTYSTSTNGAASQALAAGSVRIAKIVSGASSIAAASSISQATFADSLGNIIYPKGPSAPTKTQNPYKFRVHQVGAANTGNGAYAAVAFDTKDFDTGNNVASGVFTAPIAGFYQFSWAVQATLSAGASETLISALHVGGTIKAAGNAVSHPGTAATVLQGSAGSVLYQLAANDTVDIRVFASATRALNVTSIDRNYFTGFLVSAT